MASQEGPKVKKQPLHAPWSAFTDELAHEQTEVESTHVNEQTFENVLSAS